MHGGPENWVPGGGVAGNGGREKGCQLGQGGRHLWLPLLGEGFQGTVALLPRVGTL